MSWQAVAAITHGCLQTTRMPFAHTWLHGMLRTALFQHLIRPWAPIGPNRILHLPPPQSLVDYVKSVQPSTYQAVFKESLDERTMGHVLRALEVDAQVGIQIGSVLCTAATGWS